MFFKRYVFGDSAVYYVETPVEGHEGKTTVGLAVYPADAAVTPEKLCCDSLVQVAFTGDEGLIDYTFGVTMRNRAGTLVKVESQAADENGVTTLLSDDRGNLYTHVLEYARGTGVFTVWVRYENCTGSAQTLESLQSFSLSGIADPATRTTRGLRLHRMTSAWSRECRMKEDAFSAIGMDMSWGRYGVKVERWGQAGSMPNRGWYPFAAVEGGGIVWAVQIEAPFSWQLELYEEKETCALSGGMGDYEYAHWRKTIAPGESFSTPKAYVCVTRGGVLAACNALVHEQDRRLTVPGSEEDMPVLYNEYCLTWGNPTSDLMDAIVRALEPFPIRYLVMDSGWYKPVDKSWCNAIGDWNENPEIFPRGGLKGVAERIRAAGMKAGIWFEYEVAGRDSDVFYDEDKFLRRDGTVITSKNRRFLDFRKPEVRTYFEDKVVKFLRDNGFEYIKIDYNDTFGVGCDGAESLGEGGRQVTEESLRSLGRLKEAIPGIVIENCSSGGSRIEPCRMGMVSMCSFSDAHECAEIPLVAANVSRVIPARQSQIWAVLRDSDTPSRTIYSMCAAMMGRICISGEVLNLPPQKIRLLQDGFAFYEKVKNIVRDGDIRTIDCDVEYYRRPTGRQIYVKDLGDERLVIVHRLEAAGPIAVAAEGYALADAYTDLTYSFEDGVLRISDPGDYKAGAFLLKKSK